jgi:hypothetical protein
LNHRRRNASMRWLLFSADDGLRIPCLCRSLHADSAGIGMQWAHFAQIEVLRPAAFEEDVQPNSGNAGAKDVCSPAYFDFAGCVGFGGACVGLFSGLDGCFGLMLFAASLRDIDHSFYITFGRLNWSPNEFGRPSIQPMDIARAAPYQYQRLALVVPNAATLRNWFADR